MSEVDKKLQAAVAALLGVEPEEVTEIVPVMYRITVRGDSPRVTSHHTIELSR